MMIYVGSEAPLMADLAGWDGTPWAYLAGKKAQKQRGMLLTGHDHSGLGRRGIQRAEGVGGG